MSATSVLKYVNNRGTEVWGRAVKIECSASTQLVPPMCTETALCVGMYQSALLRGRKWSRKVHKACMT